MAKPRLKVYRAQMGFVEVVVAASSQAAALKAWGARQNLFAEDMASVTDEPEAVEPALAYPGVVLRRTIGTTGRFAETAAPPDIPDAPKRTGATKKAVEAPAPKRSPLDRAALTRAEQALAKIDADEAHDLADIAHAREELDAREAEVNGKARDRRRGAAKALEDAKRDYVRLGGEP